MESAIEATAPSKKRLSVSAIIINIIVKIIVKVVVKVIVKIIIKLKP